MAAAKRILAALCVLAIAPSSTLAAEVTEGEAPLRAKRRGSKAAPAGGAGGTSRIKDLAEAEGVRRSQPIGYGLVAGLADTAARELFSLQESRAS